MGVFAKHAEVLSSGRLTEAMRRTWSAKRKGWASILQAHSCTTSSNLCSSGRPCHQVHCSRDPRGEGCCTARRGYEAAREPEAPHSCLVDNADQEGGGFQRHAQSHDPKCSTSEGTSIDHNQAMHCRAQRTPDL